MHNALELRDDVVRGLRQGRDQNLTARLLTLTDGAERPMHLTDFNAAFRAFRRGLGWDHYVSVLNQNDATGRLHRHVVALGGPYVPQGTLSGRAEEVGLGHVVDVRRIGTSQRDRASVATYMARNALTYAVALHDSGVRIVPVSRSR